MAPLAVVGLFVEALWSIRLPCTLALVVPGVVPVMGSRQHAGIAAGLYIAGASVVFWLNATGWWFAYPEGVAALGSGAMMAVVAVALWQSESDTKTAGWLAAAAGALFGAASAWLWLPCVGSELGTLLNRSGDQTFGLIPHYGVYVAGVAAPLIPLAAAPFAWPRLRAWRDHDRTRHLVLALGLLLAFGVAFGFYEDAVGTLRRWSLQIQ